MYPIGYVTISQLDFDGFQLTLSILEHDNKKCSKHKALRQANSSAFHVLIMRKRLQKYMNSSAYPCECCTAKKNTSLRSFVAEAIDAYLPVSIFSVLLGQDR